MTSGIITYTGSESKRENVLYAHVVNMTNQLLTLSLPVTRICVNFSTVYNAGGKRVNVQDLEI